MREYTVVDSRCVRQKYESKGLVIGGEKEDLAEKSMQRGSQATMHLL